MIINYLKIITLFFKKEILITQLLATTSHQIPHNYEDPSVQKNN